MFKTRFHPVVMVVFNSQRKKNIAAYLHMGTDSAPIKTNGRVPVDFHGCLPQNV